MPELKCPQRLARYQDGLAAGFVYQSDIFCQHPIWRSAFCLALSFNTEMTHSSPDRNSSVIAALFLPVRTDLKATLIGLMKMEVRF